MKEVQNCLNQFFPQMSEPDKQDFIYSFFPFMFGIYPYTIVTEKQKQAMEQADVHYVCMTIYEITYRETRKLLEACLQNTKEH